MALDLDIARLARLELGSVLNEMGVSIASQLLTDPATRLVDGAPTCEQVRHLLPTLMARQANSARSGATIHGLDQLIPHLAAMAGSAIVLGYGLLAPNVAGVIYLSGESEQLIGAAIVDRHPA